jgi:predicted Zn-dependent peptidase
VHGLDRAQILIDHRLNRAASFGDVSLQPSKPGSIAIRSYTETGSTVEAIDMALGVLGQLHDGGIGDDLLVSAQNYVLGQFPTSLETAAQLAAEYAELEFFDLGTDYVDNYGAAIEAVTAASVKQVIDAVYPSRDELVFVLLGDAELIRDKVKQYGTITELPITAPRFRAN